SHLKTLGTHEVLVRVSALDSSAHSLEQLLAQEPEVQGVSVAVVPRNSENAEKSPRFSARRHFETAVNLQRFASPVSLKTVEERVGRKDDVRPRPAFFHQPAAK